MIRVAIPYLILNGAAKAAVPFYESALGAKTKVLQRFGEVIPNCPEARRDLVMHAELVVGSGTLMLSDGPGEGAPLTGGPVNVALDFNDESEFRRCFNALAEKGKVIQAPIDAPWGALFGSVSDRFGITWMMTSSYGS